MRCGYVVAAGLSVVTCGLATGQPSDSALERLVTRIANAESLEAAAQGYTELFKSPDLKLVLQLKNVPQHGVALRSAWEETLLEAKFRRDEETKPPPGQRIAIARFLGFVEGRLGVRPPPWWQESVQNAYVRKGQLGLQLPEKSPYHKIELEDDVLEMPIGQSLKPLIGKSIRMGETGVVLQSEDDSITVPAELVKEYFRHEDHFSLLFDKERCFVSCHSALRYSFQLLCL